MPFIVKFKAIQPNWTDLDIIDDHFVQPDTTENAAPSTASSAEWNYAALALWSHAKGCKLRFELPARIMVIFVCYSDL